MFQLDQEQVTDSGKFRRLDELLPTLQNQVKIRILIYCYVHQY